MDSEIQDIETGVEEAVYTFMTDIAQFAETYGWLKLRIDNITSESAHKYGGDVSVAVKFSVKEILK